MFEDMVLRCIDCGAEFVFTAGEQSFYSEKGLLNEPRRCPDCRDRRRQEREQGVEYPIICAECGQEATVPFVPSEDRPVYCDECYRKRREREEGRKAPRPRRFKRKEQEANR
ncbi:MAG: zinc-ribbon domain containing protein [Chloroflexia bacterium]|nr:zinc-ribbon domain containing protein [Chloroflexia bacterium]